MSIKKDIGIATAYGYAVSKGYTGTEEEFAELMASYASVGQTAIQAAESASASATASAGSAAQSAQSATNAQAAAEGAVQAAEQELEEYVASANQKATEAAQSATNASTSATNATGSATDAGTEALKAEGVTLGKQNGVDVGSDSPYYHANSKYYSEQAQDVYNQAVAVKDSIPADYTALSGEVDNLKADLSELGTRVDNIEEAEGLRRYGVSGIGQSANALTRLWDSVGMTAQVGTDGDNSNVINNFDDVTPFNRRKCVGDWYIEDGRAVFHVNAYYGDEDFAEDGSMGSFVAVECPRAYYYLKDSVLGVSAHQYPGWRPFDIFCHKHNENETIPYYYKNAYALAIDENGHAVSLPGYDNAQGDYKTLLDEARTYKNGELGNLPMLMPAAYNFYEWALFTVEFATQHCQEVMQGCAGLRHSDSDLATFVDASHVITNNYYATRVVGECIAIIAANVDQNSAAYQATHRIVAITRCDENGDASATGTHQLVELEDLGKEYYEYDVTGATEYRFVARPYRTGDCNSVSTPSGSPVSNSDSYHPCKYRWHENPYSNQYKTVMDLFNQKVGTDADDYYLKWYLLDDPTQFASKNIGAADLETDAFVELDIVTEHSNYRDGYIKSKKYSERYPDIWIPHETTGSSTTYTCDYAYIVNSSVVRSVRFGGYWYSDAYAGFSYALAFSAPLYGNAYYGGDLCIAQ